MIKSENGNATCASAPFMNNKFMDEPKRKTRNITPPVTPANCTYCCGKQMERKDDVQTCVVCGTEYKDGAI